MTKPKTVRIKTPNLSLKRTQTLAGLVRLARNR